MSISGIQSGAHAIGYGDAVRTPEATAASGFAETLAGVSQDGQEAKGAESTAEYPLEAYSIPNWYADLFGGYTTLSSKLGASYEESRTGYDRLNAGDQQLYNEYSGILDAAFHDGLDMIGVSGDTGKYYNEFVKNGDNQRLVREAIYDSLESNPRAVELMKYFDITTG